MENNENKVVEVELFAKEELLTKIDEYQKKLDDLRAEGVTLIDRLKNENSNIKANKQINKEQKASLIAANNERIQTAKTVKAEKAEEIKALVKESVTLLKTNYKVYIKELKETNSRKIAKATEIFKEEQEKIVEEHSTKIAEINALNQETISKAGDDKEALKEAHAICKGRTGDETLRFKQKTSDSKVRFQDIKSKHKDEEHELYLEMTRYEDSLTNGHIGIISMAENKFENYIYNFKIKNFILNNGLYVGILILLIFTIIYYAAVNNGAFLLGSNQIADILENVSPKIFFALGVACIIVLGGTDLSIGSLVGMGAVFTVMMLSTDGTTTLMMFNKPISFAGIPLGVRVVLAFTLSIASCVAFSAIAGYFTAKFKMHPFISTLSTQLIVVGLISIITNNSRTTYADSNLKQALTGRIGNFPIMVIFAVIAIIIMWFIWNKTKFGKNLYAVGGNGEAATVSGISVFKTTLLAFVLAGIYYGFGSSLYGIYSGATFGTMAAGMEADAIAACVVGGVSFSGGVGKISGVVIGAILFQAITYILVLLGVTDSNAQFVIKGIIILAAVSLDCAKYLKKK